jgi:chromosome condensin MukBEF MukE localization factor
MSTMTEWKEKYEKEHKLRQEAEGELSIIKATTVFNSPEMREAIRTIKNLETRLAEVLSLEDSHQKLNGKLQERLTEVEEDNKKLANQIDDKINQLRRSGL